MCRYRCVRTVRPVTFARPDATTLERARPEARDALNSHSSFLALPMTARGVAVGLLVVSRGPDRPAFSEAETGLLAGIAARTGNWIVHASLLAERSPTWIWRQRNCCGSWIARRPR